MKQKRAILFIDGRNFEHGLEREGILPIENYKRLSEKLTEEQGHQWLATRFYVGQVTQEENEKSKELYQKQRSFVSSLKKQSDRIKVSLGSVKKIPVRAAQRLDKWLKNRQENPNVAHIPRAALEELGKIAQEEKFHWKEKKVDVMIASDMVAMAHKGEFDIAYLLSADGDYTHAVKLVLETNRKVFIVSAEAQNARGLAEESEAELITLDKKFFAELKEA